MFNPWRGRKQNAPRKLSAHELINFAVRQPMDFGGRHMEMMRRSNNTMTWLTIVLVIGLLVQLYLTPLAGPMTTSADSRYSTILLYQNMLCIVDSR